MRKEIVDCNSTARSLSHYTYLQMTMTSLTTDRSSGPGLSFSRAVSRSIQLHKEFRILRLILNCHKSQWASDNSGSPPWKEVTAMSVNGKMNQREGDTRRRYC